MEDNKERTNERVLLVIDNKDLDFIKIDIPKSFLSSKEGLFKISILGQLTDYKKKGINLRQIEYSLLTSKGVIDIPVVLTFGSKTYFLFLYQNKDQDSANVYYSIKTFLEKHEMTEFEGRKIICAALSQGRLPTRKKTIKVGREICASDLSKLEKLPIGKEFAMWWTTKKNQKFVGSKTQKAIRETYRALDGIETYIFSMFCKQLGMCDKKTARLRLPNESLTIPLRGPNNEEFLLNVSQEKGFRFQFNTEKISEEYRDLFWLSFSEYAKGWKQGALDQKFPLDDYKDLPRPLKWYSLLEESFKHEDKDNGTLKIGLVILNTKNNKD
ncbi:hypothetical protein HYY69_00170 [Candidatus Woesearchaeota archaeon]|nr:hypothetical protein [Candidatus Woesearchaeota archaeon]